MVSTQEYIYTIQWHFLHPDTFTNGCLVAQVILHWDACTHKCSWARTLVGSGWKHSDLGDLNQSGIKVPSSLMCRFTHKMLGGRCFYVQALLDRSTCSQRWFRKEELLAAGVHRQVSLNTGMLFHTGVFFSICHCFYTPVLWWRGASARKCFYTEIL